LQKTVSLLDLLLAPAMPAIEQSSNTTLQLFTGELVMEIQTFVKTLWSVERAEQFGQTVFF
jgi:hypothetical protein